MQRHPAPLTDAGAPTDAPSSIDTGPAGPALRFTSSGTFTGPAGEHSTHPTLIASTSYIAYAASSYAGPPVPLVFSGSPPTTSYTLTIDAAALGAGVGNVILSVFDDANDHGVNDLGERVVSVGTSSTSCPLFCDGTGCSSPTYIDHLQAGGSGTGRRGSYTITQTGWYGPTGCSGGDHSCDVLITQPAIPGVDLMYTLPLVP